MKRIFILSLVLLILVSISSCTPQDTHTKQPDTNNDIPVIQDKIEDCDVQYIRTDGYHEEVSYPVVKIIRSKKELSDYYEDNKDKYSLERRTGTIYSDSTIGFLDACDKYDDEYFENKSVLMILLEEPSGSIRHRVESVFLENGEILVDISKFTPEASTDDMAEWHIFVEVDVPASICEQNVTVLIDGMKAEEKEMEAPETNEYTGQWLDVSKREKYENVFSDIIITEIYSNCFFAKTVVPLPYYIKLNGTLSSDWCVGDQVVCTYENVYVDKETSRIEADLITVEQSTFELDPFMCYKPVIYLYPEKLTDVSVKLSLTGEITCTYPEYKNGWQVLAYPDGTLTDESGEEYNYLYWEGETSARYDFSEGFCVKGEDTSSFLEEALEKLGLNRREANEFIVFWLPLMQKNEYNVISFQTDAYTDSALLDITPTPNTLIRVFMAYRPAEEFVNIKPQELITPKREGFCVVEWGGTQV